MSEPIYRPIPAEDEHDVVRIDSEAFGVPASNMRGWLAGERMGELRGLYHNGRLVAQTVLYVLPIGVGNGEALFGGLGSVASPPEARRRGYIATLMRHVIEELRERNVSLSVLWPFRLAFYRQFGYAICEERRRYSGPTAVLAPFRSRLGQWEPATAASIPDLDRVYRSALRGRFGVLMRPEAWWRELLNRDGRHAYLWRDENGTARTYCIYDWEKDAAGKTMACRECVALDPLARAQLFGFMADHDNQAHTVSFPAPPDAPVQALLPEVFRSEVHPVFTLRIVDIIKAFADYPVPPGVAGRLTVAVTDQWLPANAGVYVLDVAEGRVVAERLPDGTPADLGCDVATLAQLYSRYLRPRTAATFGVLDVHNRAALSLAEKMFAGLAPFSSDYF